MDARRQQGLEYYGPKAGWRLRRFQPEDKAVKQRQAAFDTAKAKSNSPARKRLNVGLSRQFIVDWWRIKTGRTTAQKLGLQMSWPTCASLRGKQPTAAADVATPQPEIQQAT